MARRPGATPSRSVGRVAVLSRHHPRCPKRDTLVRGAKTTTSYRARDLHHGELWSRIQPGEALQFTLTVAAADRSKVALQHRQPAGRLPLPGSRRARTIPTTAS